MMPAVQRYLTRIHNIIVVGDRLLGRTDQQAVVIGKLTPDVIDRGDLLLEVEPMDAVNALGKIDLLARAPNSDEVFLVEHPSPGPPIRH